MSLPAPPTSIGPYRVLGVLGVGGAGAVYRCQAPDGRPVAVKLPQLYGPDDALRFERECRLQRELSGDGVLPLLDLGRSAQGPYAVLPLVEGGSLHDRLRLGPMPWREAVALVRRVARAVGRMHAAGVVHRDLKPANVLLDREGAPWVADLGLSKHADRGRDPASVSFSQTGALAGTPGYMAPEQAFDAKSVGPAADVFSLGVMLYAAIAGRQPFAASTAAACISRSASGDYVPLSAAATGVPGWLVDVVHAALSSDPERRPGTGDALAERLRAPRVEPEARTRRPPPALVGIGLGVVVGVVALALTRGGGSTARPGAEAPLDATPTVAVDPTPTEAEADPTPTEAEADPTPTEPEPADPRPAEPESEPEPAPIEPEPATRGALIGVGERQPVLRAWGGHQVMVREVAVDAAGGTVLTGEYGAGIQLLNLEDARVLAQWVDFTWEAIEGLAVVPGGPDLALSRAGHLVLLHEGGGHETFASGHPKGADLDVGGGWVASAGSDGLRLRTVESAWERAAAPDLACAGPLQIARFHPTGQVGLALGPEGCWGFDVRTGAERVKLPARTYEDLAWSPDGKLLATLDNQNVVRLYTWPELDPRGEQTVWERPQGQPRFYNTRSVCFSVDGRQLYTGDATPAVRTWKVPEHAYAGDATPAVRIPELEPVRGWSPGWSSWVEQIRRAPDGTLIVCGNSRTAGRFTPDGRPRWTRPLIPFSYPGPGPGGEPTMLDTPDGLHWLEGGRLALNTELGLAVLDPASGRWEREPPGPASVVGERMVVRGRRVAWVGRGTLVCGSLQLEGGRVEGQRAVAGAFEDVHLGASGEVIALEQLDSGARLSSFDAELNPIGHMPAPQLGARVRFAEVWGAAPFLAPYGRQRLIGLAEGEDGTLKAAFDVPLGPHPPGKGDLRCLVGAEGFVAVRPGAAWLQRRDGRSFTVPLAGLRGDLCLEGVPGGFAVGGFGVLAVFSGETGALLGRVELGYDAVVDLLATPAGDALFVWTRRGDLLRVPLLRER